MRRDWNVEHRLRGEARDCFIRAAASLTEMPTEENVGFAVFNGALGMMRLAQSDTESRALDHVLRTLAKVKADRAAIAAPSAAALLTPEEEEGK